MRTYSFENTEMASTIIEVLKDSWKVLPVGSLFNYLSGKDDSELEPGKLAFHTLYAAIGVTALFASLMTAVYASPSSSQRNPHYEKGLESKVQVMMKT